VELKISSEESAAGREMLASDEGARRSVGNSNGADGDGRSGLRVAKL